MNNIYGIIKDTHAFIRPIAEPFLMFVMLVIAITIGIGYYVSSVGYEPRYQVILRYVSYLSVLIALSVNVLAYKFRLFKNINESSLLSTVAKSLAVIYTVYAANKFRTNPGVVNEVLFGILLYASIYSFALFLYLSPKLERKKNSYILLLVPLVFALVLPIFNSKYLNSESYPNYDDIASLGRMYKTIIPEQNNEISITITAVEEEVFRLNLSELVLSDAYTILGKYALSANGSSVDLKFTLDSQNITALCLLGRYSKEGSLNDFHNMTECMYYLIYAKYKDGNDYRTSLAKVPYANNVTKEKILTKIRGHNFNNLKTIDSNGTMSLVKSMFIRGAFFHHYNSVANGIHNNGGVGGLINNQYGPGPLILINIIASVTSLSIFDSIYVAVLIVNLLVALFLTLITRSCLPEEKLIVWWGFASSIIVIFAISNMMAPMLFFIRMLPTVIMCILIAHSGISRVSIFSGNLSRLLFIMTSVIMVFYNFEYAVLTSIALVAGGVLISEKKYVVSGIFILFSSIFLKVIFYSPAYIGANYAAYFSGNGLGNIDAITILFMGSVFLVVPIIYTLNKNDKLNSETTVLVCIFLSLCFKVSWMGSANHIGPLFLILSLIVFVANREFQLDSDVHVQKWFVGYKFMSMMIILLALVLCIRGYPYNNKIKTINYTDSSISRLFSLSTSMNEKLMSFSDIYRKGDLVISPVDNALELYVSERLTAPYPDLSTNINGSLDVSRVVDSYLNREIKRRIIVDAYIENSETWNELYGNIAKYPDTLIHGLNSYSLGLYDMSRVLDIMKARGYKECGRNRHFTVYCAP